MRKLFLPILFALGALGLVGVAQATEPPDDDCVIVVDTPAQHYSWTGGPIAVDPPPAFPDGNWQANTTQEPHLAGGGSPATWVGTEGVGLHYTSHGSSGLADWFYFQPEESHEECDPPPTTSVPDDDPCPNGPDGSDECPCPETGQDDPCEPPPTTEPPPPTTEPPCPIDQDECPPPTTEPPPICDPPGSCEPPPCVDPVCEPPEPPPPICAVLDDDGNTVIVDCEPERRPGGPVEATPPQTG